LRKASPNVSPARNFDMRRRPIILIAPSTAAKGEEFSDASISLSNRYTDAVIAAGGLPAVFSGNDGQGHHRRGGATVRRRLADWRRGHRSENLRPEPFAALGEDGGRIGAGA